MNKSDKWENFWRNEKKSSLPDDFFKTEYQENDKEEEIFDCIIYLYIQHILVVLQKKGLKNIIHLLWMKSGLTEMFSMTIAN